MNILIGIYFSSPHEMKLNVSTLTNKGDTSPNPYFQCCPLSCCLDKPEVLSSSCHQISCYLMF